jgi:AbrB family looped-hinge helix DNA binding protein
MNMSLTMEARVGKKYAIYLPKAIVKALGLKEGERVLLRVSGNTLILEALQDPVQLALSGEKFASIKSEQVEAISLEEQAGQVEGSP